VPQKGKDKERGLIRLWKRVQHVITIVDSPAKKIAPSLKKKGERNRRRKEKKKIASSSQNPMEESLGGEEKWAFFQASQKKRPFACAGKKIRVHPFQSGKKREKFAQS